MTEAAVNLDLHKSKPLVFLEYILLALCLCVIALRATYVEGPGPKSAAQLINLSDSVYSLSISAVLILSFVVWFVWSFCSGRFHYRLTGMEIGLCLFCIAAVIAGLAASDKRAAITDFVTLLAPVLCAVLLVQILDSHSKIKLTLVVIAALGVVSAYQCEEQLFHWNEQQIKFYQQNPYEVLAQQDIAPNSLRHWLFEHRLYSRGVHGFFTTGNSAGSFMILASFAAIALFIEKFKNRRYYAFGSVWSITCGIAVMAVFFGLVITRSKGAITAALIAAVMFIAFLYFGNWLKAHKKAILAVCLFLVLIGGCVVVSYGLAHGRLPGGNSMLVRWQYWHASARMYADNFLTGVGPGNFVHFYPRYKTPSALETVADPHNFPLTVITQYGPLGLAGFLAIIFTPLFRAISSNLATNSSKTSRPPTTIRALAVIFLIVISIVMLLIRPMILKIPATGSLEEKRAAEIIFYVMPVVVFVVGFLLLTPGLYQTRDTQYAIRNTIAAALFCAVLGCLIHNLIDFAIFEPGVFTTLCAIIAVLIATDFNQRSRPQFVLKPALFVRVIVVAAAVVIIFAYLNYCLIPVAKSTAKIQQAKQADDDGRFQHAHNLLAVAAKDDSLSPTTLFLNARLYLQQFHISESKQTDLLLQAENCLLNAIERNSADFKNFERLTRVYTLLADSSTGRAKIDWLNKAFDSADRAVELYPGSGRLRFELAKIAEQLDKTDTAIEQYRKAVDIEDSFRVQFRQMYPGREVFSRLGEEKYRNAKQRIKQLSDQPTQ